VCKPIIYLSLLELEKIENKIFGIDRLDKIKDCFLFACYTGLAFVDLEKITKDNLIEVSGRKLLHIHRTKTKIEAWIPLTQKALAIWERYKYKLPVLTNQKYNAYLKEIQDLCNISKKLTTHVARRTFANLMLNVYAVPYETVSKLLAHADINTAQKYYVNVGLEKVLRDTEGID
jgi:integrase